MAFKKLAHRWDIGLAPQDYTCKSVADGKIISVKLDLKP